MSQYYLLYRDNDQANGSRVLSQQSNLCRDIKSCKMEDFCHDKGKLCRNIKWKSIETSQAKFVTTKISMLQQTVQLATKIKEICCDIFKVCHDIKFRFSNTRQQQHAKL